ncbi:hypothetical protein [Nocardia sp. NPDC057455]|uniref:hypothetical protein n=1 Tax=Nocardia sp. NPDC057455 TaxID=3346138 RepID=UPI00366B7686
MSTAAVPPIQPPRNVRIDRGGFTTRLELVYAGFRDGKHHWCAATPYNPGRDTLRADYMPPDAVIDWPKGGE